MTSQKEKNNKVIAAATTTGMYAVLFLLFFFTVAWRTPYPPIPAGGGGIELNFGLDDQGSGDIQPDEPVGVEKPQPQQEEPQPEQIKQEEKQPETKPDDSEVVSTSEESPITVKKEEPKKKEVKTEPVKPVDNPVKETPKKEEAPKTVYNPNSNTTGTDGKQGKPGNHGDDEGKTGDKGNPQGSLDANALYGNQGSGGDGSGKGRGVGLALAGWNWDSVPDPVIPGTETGGRLVFEIKVDNEGEIISIKTLERSVSLETEKACRKEVEKLTFTKTGANVPAVSTGKITFVVRSN